MGDGWQEDGHLVPGDCVLERCFIGTVESIEGIPVVNWELLNTLIHGQEYLRQ